MSSITTPFPLHSTMLSRSPTLLAFVVPLFTAAATLVGAPLTAQTGWTQWTTGTGANNHWYLAVYVPGGINWSTARTKAQALGGDLATVTSAAENAFVFQLIANPVFWRQPQTGPTRIFGPWLGGYQPPGSPEPLGMWSWVSGETWSYTNWDTGEPNNLNGEDHLHFYAPGTTPQPVWNDHNSTVLVPGFIVESIQPPTASYLPLGTGCTPAGSQPPTLGPAVAGVDLPRLGTSSVLRVASLPPATSLVVFGFGSTNRYTDLGNGPTRLPINLSNLGWNGCSLLIAPDLAVVHTVNGPTVDHVVTVPPNPALLGVALFAQALALQPTSAALTASIAGYVGP